MLRIPGTLNSEFLQEFINPHLNLETSFSGARFFVNFSRFRVSLALQRVIWQHRPSTLRRTPISSLPALKSLTDNSTISATLFSITMAVNFESSKPFPNHVAVEWTDVKGMDIRIFTQQQQQQPNARGASQSRLHISNHSTRNA